MLNQIAVRLEKGDIKLVEYSDGNFVYDDKIFIQSGCVGFYASKDELEDIRTVIDYYLNLDKYDEIKVSVGGEYVSK